MVYFVEDFLKDVPLNMRPFHEGKEFKTRLGVDEARSALIFTKPDQMILKW